MGFLALKSEEWHDCGDVCKEDICPRLHCESQAYREQCCLDPYMQGHWLRVGAEQKEEAHLPL